MFRHHYALCLNCRAKAIADFGGIVRTKAVEAVMVPGTTICKNGYRDQPGRLLRLRQQISAVRPTAD